jgi:hypothetical protein
MRVDVRRIKAEDELKSIFGAKTIHAVAREEDGGRGAPRGPGGGVLGRRGPGGRAAAAQASLVAASRARSVLVSSKDTWPAHRRGQSGLRMEYVGVDPDSLAKVFRYVRDGASGEDAKRAFDAARASHDPNRLVAMLHHYPWHVDALMALADIYVYTGEGSHSAETLEKALFALEGAWHPWFASAAASGGARMDGSGAEPANELFFAAMFKHANALSRRGCHRAALEIAKFALGLDRTDPRGFLCCVDYFALRAGRVRWAARFARDFRAGDGREVAALPGIAYSVALAMHLGANGAEGAGKREGGGDDDDEDSLMGGGSVAARKAAARAALLRAQLMHPYATVALAATLDEKFSNLVSSDPAWTSALRSPHFAGARDALRNRGLEHLCHLFAERHKVVWKSEDALAFLRDGAAEAARRAAAPTEPLAATGDGLCARDYAAMREETFPPDDDEGDAKNPYAHLSVEDFSDDVKRQMPEGDENPFLRRGPFGGRGRRRDGGGGARRRRGVRARRRRRRRARARGDPPVSRVAGDAPRGGGADARDGARGAPGRGDAIPRRGGASPGGAAQPAPGILQDDVRAGARGGARGGAQARDGSERRRGEGGPRAGGDGGRGAGGGGRRGGGAMTPTTRRRETFFYGGSFSNRRRRATGVESARTRTSGGAAARLTRTHHSFVALFISATFFLSWCPLNPACTFVAASVSSARILAVSFLDWNPRNPLCSFVAAAFSSSAIFFVSRLLLCPR